MSIEYWLKGDIPPGPIKAIVISDIKRLVNTIKQYKKPLIIIGPDIVRIEKLVGENVLEKIINISSHIKADLMVSDGNTIRKLDGGGYKNYKIMFPLESIQKLASNKSSYDLVIFVGFHYYYGWLLLNYLKHYAYKHLSTISLEPYAQPNSSWTLPSLPLSIWYKNLCQLEEELKASSTTT